MTGGFNSSTVRLRRRPVALPAIDAPAVAASPTAATARNPGALTALPAPVAAPGVAAPASVPADVFQVDRPSPRAAASVPRGVLRAGAETAAKSRGVSYAARCAAEGRVMRPVPPHSAVNTLDLAALRAQLDALSAADADLAAVRDGTRGVFGNLSAAIRTRDAQLEALEASTRAATAAADEAQRAAAKAQAVAADREQEAARLREENATLSAALARAVAGLRAVEAEERRLRLIGMPVASGAAQQQQQGRAPRPPSQVPHSVSAASGRRASRDGSLSPPASTTPNASTTGPQAVTRGCTLNGLDWRCVLLAMPELDVEDREDSAILWDVAARLQFLTEQVNDLQVQNEVAVERFSESDRLGMAAAKERDALATRLRLQESKAAYMTEELQRARADRATAELASAAARQQWEAERTKLQYRLLEANVAVSKTVEARKYFVGYGRRIAVAPFLRFEGRVKNLDLPKVQLEALINRIWSRRDPGSASVRRVQRAVAAVLRAYNGDAAFHAFLPTPPVSDEDVASDGGGLQELCGDGATVYDATTELECLKDADNVIFARRVGAADFSEFLTDLVTHPGTASFLLHGDGGATRPTRAGSARAHRPTVTQARRTSTTTTTIANRKPNGAVGARAGGGALTREVAELTYSLMEGCERFKYDADVELFRRIAAGEAPELAYFDQMVMLVKLRGALLLAGRQMLRAQDATRTDYDGTAPLGAIVAALAAFFPAKSADDLEVLRQALVMEVPGADELAEAELVEEKLSIARLFESNAHGNQGPFAEAVRDQHLEDTCLYAAEVASAIAACRTSEAGSPAVGEEATAAGDVETSIADVPRGSPRATLQAIADAIHPLDPARPRSDVDAFVRRVADLVVAGGGDARLHAPVDFAIATFDCEHFARVSQRVFSKRIGPRS